MYIPLAEFGSVDKTLVLPERVVEEVVDACAFDNCLFPQAAKSVVYE